MVQLTADKENLDADVAAATEKAEGLEAESAQLRAARAMNGGRLEPEAPAAPAAAEPTPREGLFTKMFKDPEMRSMLEGQQAAALQKLYADYLKEANLTADQKERFFQILQDRQMALMNSSENALTGGAVDMKAATASTNAANEAIKELLEPEQYRLYEVYEKNLGPRVQVAQLNQQLTGLGAPLKEYQGTALVQIISEENAMLPAFGENAASEQELDASDIDQYARQIDAVDQRIYQRAGALLTPEQLAVLSTFLKNMAATQIAGLRMAGQMLNGK